MCVKSSKQRTKMIYNKEDFDDTIFCLKENNETFSVLFSSSKLVILFKSFKYTFYPNKLASVKGLHFIKTLKDYIKNNDIKYNFNLKIPYMAFNMNLKNSVNYKKDLYEIDLKGAYWQMFNRHFNISKELYNEGLKVDKKIRLMALGSLAKRVNRFNYSGNNLVSNENIKSIETEGIFFKCAYETDLIMRNLINSIAKENYIFYWVDAIFFRGEKNVKVITDILRSQSLDFKIVPIKRIIKKANLIEVEDFDFKKRDFNFKKINVNKLTNE